MHLRGRNFSCIPAAEAIALLILGAILWTSGAGAAVSTHQVNVPNATPVISAVTLNNGSAITLTAGTTTAIHVNFTVSDSNGCGDVLFSGNITTTVMRYNDGGGQFPAACSSNTLNCYVLSSVTSHSCPSATSSQASANATATVSIYYFAQATDASSSFPMHMWGGYIQAQDASSSNATNYSSGVELNTLLAIELATTSISYGTLSPGTNTSGTNQTVTTKNAGNASTSMNISGTALSLGGRAFPTSSQHYATSTFTYGGLEQALSAAAQTVSGFLIPRPPLTSWATGTSMTYNTRGHSTVALNSYIYSIGGTSGDYSVDTVSFAPINATGSLGSWAFTATTSARVAAHASIVWNGYLYVIGGYDNFLGTAFDAVRVTQPSATGSLVSWTTTTALPNQTYSHTAVAHNGYAYVLGGQDISALPTSTVLFAPISATGSIGAWSTTTPLPSPRHSHASVISGNYLYALGGASSSATTTVLFAAINATGSVGSWALTTPLPSPLTARVMAASDNGIIYVVAGGTSTALFAPVSANGELGSWSGTQSYPVSEVNHASVVNNGYVYITGGTSGSPFGITTTRYAPLSSRNTYWGLDAPAGYASGTYTGTVTYTAVFHP